MPRVALATAVILLAACNHDDAIDAGVDAGDGAARDAGDAGVAPPDAGDAGDAGEAGPDLGPTGCLPTTWDGTMPTNGVCSPSGWCAVAPSPLGTLEWGDVSSAGPTDTWATSYGGAIIRWDGTRWAGTSVGPGHAIRVQAVSPTDVWISGLDAGGAWDVQHWDGTRFTAFAVPDGPTMPALTSFVGFTYDDAWVAGDLGRVEHWDGSSWTPVDVGAGTANLAIGGVAGNDLWVNGTGGVLRHYDGTAWTDRAFASAHTLVAFPRDGHVWAVGGDVRRWDGTAWTPITFAHIDDGVTSGVADDAGHIYFSGQYRGIYGAYYWDGATLTNVPPLDVCRSSHTASVFGPSSAAHDGTDYVFAFARCDYDHPMNRVDRVHWTGPGTTATITADAAGEMLFGLTPLASDDDVLYRDLAGVERGVVGGAHTRQAQLEGHGWPLHGDVDAGDVWTIGTTAGTVEHFDGTAWTPVFVHAGTISDVAVTSGHVIALVDGVPYVRAAATWTPEPSVTASSLEEAGGDTAYAFGNFAAAFFDGTTWTSIARSPLGRVDCAAPRTGMVGHLDAFGAGIGPQLRATLDGTTVVTEPTTPPFAFGVCAAREGRIIAVDRSGGGGGAPLFHYYDGTSWCSGSYGPTDFYGDAVAIGPGGRAWIGVNTSFASGVDQVLLEKRP